MSTNSLAPGAVINSPQHRYIIRAVLGEGGFGITYSATYQTTVSGLPVQVVVALKEHFLKADCERDATSHTISFSTPATERYQNSLKDFIGEAQRLARISPNHNNIVKVSEVFEANNTAYYVMEYLEGQSLSSYIKQNGPMPPAQALGLMWPIIDAVAYLHRNRVTHLDIKPANIMLAHDADGNPRPVLIDFGLSKGYDEHGSATSTVRTMGLSDGYAPVEQYLGIQTFSPASDVYSLAATLVYCLTGNRLPNAGEFDVNTLPSLVPMLTPSHQQVLMHALAYRRDTRTPNAGALLDELYTNPQIQAESNQDETHILAQIDETAILENNNPVTPPPVSPTSRPIMPPKAQPAPIGKTPQPDGPSLPPKKPVQATPKAPATNTPKGSDAGTPKDPDTGGSSKKSRGLVGCLLVGLVGLVIVIIVTLIIIGITGDTDYEEPIDTVAVEEVVEECVVDSSYYPYYDEEVVEEVPAEEAVYDYYAEPTAE